VGIGNLGRSCTDANGIGIDEARTLFGGSDREAVETKDYARSQCADIMLRKPLGSALLNGMAATSIQRKREVTILS
jgi:hypothetical protein